MDHLWRVKLLILKIGSILFIQIDAWKIYHLPDVLYMSRLKDRLYLHPFDKLGVYLWAYCECVAPSSPFIPSYELHYDPCPNKSTTKEMVQEKKNDAPIGIQQPISQEDATAKIPECGEHPRRIRNCSTAKTSSRLPRTWITARKDVLNVAPDLENSGEKSATPSTTVQPIPRPIKARSSQMEFHSEADLECTDLVAAVEMLLELQ